MAFIKVADLSGEMEVVIFPRTWTEVKSFASPDRYIIADGRVDTRDGTPKIIASRILELHPEEGVETIKATLGPLAKPAPQFKRKETRAPTVQAEKVTPLENGRLLLSVPKAMNRQTLQDIRFILEAHPGSTPVFIQAFRGNDMTQAKTRTFVTPSHDLLLLLKQAGVEAMIEGVKIEEPQLEDIEIETYMESSLPVS
jgi:DNA polymerase-3 subunit alpha